MSEPENNSHLDADRMFFADICFLRVADYDYIAGRLLYRNGLVAQALVMFQQSIEKYLKAALLYNPIPQGETDKNGHVKPTHSIKRLINNLNKGGGLKLQESSKQSLLKFEGIEEVRYRTESFGISDTDNLLPSLDEAIVDLRRYCTDGSIGKLDELSDSDINKFKNGFQLFNKPLEMMIKAQEQKKDTSWMRQEEWGHREMLFWSNGMIDGKQYNDNQNLSQNSPFGASLNPASVYKAVRNLVYLRASIHNLYETEKPTS